MKQMGRLFVLNETKRNKNRAKRNKQTETKQKRNSWLCVGSLCWVLGCLVCRSLIVFIVLAFVLVAVCFVLFLGVACALVCLLFVSFVLCFFV